MTLAEQQQKFCWLVMQLLQYIYKNGMSCTIGQAWRTIEQQEIYIKQGLSKSRSSKHLEKLAIDLNLFISGKYKIDRESYKEIGEFWKSLDPECIWGGDWGWDANHFQYTK